MTPQVLTVERQWFEAYRKPGVYVYRKDDIALYVGMGSVVGAFSRCFSRQHHRLKSLSQATHVDLYLCTTTDEAKALETKIIRDLKPILNGPLPADTLDRLKLIVKKRRQGETYETIARLLGVSRQRAHQLDRRAKQYRYRSLLESLESPEAQEPRI